MSLPTCDVTVRCYKQDGTPDPGAVVFAKLNRFEVYQGYVVPEEVLEEADQDGIAVLTLFRNALGATESTYKVRILGTSGAVVKVTATVPDAASAYLEDIATLPPYPGKSDGQFAVDQAGAYAAAAAISATASGVSATASATSATASATSAGASATSATASATSAGASATSAGASATSAAASAAYLASIQAIVAAGLPHAQEFTGAGPWTVTAPGALQIVGVRVQGIHWRMSRFSVIGLQVTNTSGVFIGATHEVDVLYA